MNLPQAIVANRVAELEQLERQTTEAHRLLQLVKGYKVQQFFHECSPGCKKDSPNREDHVPLPGQLTPTCRVLYVRALQWMAAGARYIERLFLAANRCITPWTPVEMGSATRQCGEMLGVGAFDVQSWDGDSRCARPAHGVFLKSIEPAFRIHLDNGTFFDCSRKHRILTVAGWLSFEQLIRRASGLRWWQRASGFPASCATGSCRDGRSLLPQSDSDQAPLPSQADVLERPQCWYSPAGEAARRSTRIHICRADALLSIRDDPQPIADLCAQFSDPGVWLDARWPSDERQARARWSRAYHHSRAVPEVSARQPSVLDLWESGSLAVGRTRRESSSLRQGPVRCERVDDPLLSWSEFLAAAPGSAMFSASDHLPLIGGARIIAVVPLGLQPILDFTVTSTHSYESGGVIHHNSGKTETASFEARCHLTGRYPSWWVGRRFTGPIQAWAAGDTRQTTRDIIQTSVCGPHEGVPTGTFSGMIEPHLIVDYVRASGGVANCLDTIYVRHVSGGVSELGFKSYDQGRRVFQGTRKHVIWLDEEPPDPAVVDEEKAEGSSEIWTECLLRIMTTEYGIGLLMATFTPLRGMTPFLKDYIETCFMPGTEASDVPAAGNFFPDALSEDISRTPDVSKKAASRFLIGATWAEVPHLTLEAQETLARSIPAYQRDARTKGIPQLGAGAIYPIEESRLVVPDFLIPDGWKRGYGMDVGGGAKPTAWVGGALNPENDTLYLTDVYKHESPEPSQHAAAIKRKMGQSRPDDWTWPGVGDAAALIMTEHDSDQLVYVYRQLGLDLHLADKSVETGIKEVFDRMIDGRLKVFASCHAWFQEFRLYQRKKGGRIKKANDHLMDSTRYLVRSGVDRMKVKPVKVDTSQRTIYIDQGLDDGLGWMSR